MIISTITLIWQIKMSILTGMSILAFFFWRYYKPYLLYNYMPPENQRFPTFDTSCWVKLFARRHLTFQSERPRPDNQTWTLKSTFVSQTEEKQPIPAQTVFPVCSSASCVSLLFCFSTHCRQEHSNETSDQFPHHILVSVAPQGVIVIKSLLVTTLGSSLCIH